MGKALILVITCDLWIFVVESIEIPSSGDLFWLLFLFAEIAQNGTPFSNGISISVGNQYTSSMSVCRSAVKFGPRTQKRLTGRF